MKHGRFAINGVSDVGCFSTNDNTDVFFFFFFSSYPAGQMFNQSQLDRSCLENAAQEL